MADEGGQLEDRRMDLLRGLVVAHVGHFDPTYSRNRIMATALERPGAIVVTITDPHAFLGRTPRLARRLAGVRPDAVLVGFPGHVDVLVARLARLRNRAAALLDPFLSLYETAVEGRGSHAPGSFGAVRYVLEDRLACDLSTHVILDSDAHVDYFVEHVGLPGHKLRRSGSAPTTTSCGRARHLTNRPSASSHTERSSASAGSSTWSAPRRYSRTPATTYGSTSSDPDRPRGRALAAYLGVSSVRFPGRLPVC